MHRFLVSVAFFFLKKKERHLREGVGWCNVGFDGVN